MIPIDRIDRNASRFASALIHVTAASGAVVDGDLIARQAYALADAMENERHRRDLSIDQEVLPFEGKANAQ